MQSGFQGRNRVKSVSFRGEPDVNNTNDTRQRSSFRDRDEHDQRELDDSRMVKLLPDANMTISVHNDYRDSRIRGSRGILKSNSFRDDTNLAYNNERNSQQSNRGFETFRGRGRGGKQRGFYHNNNSGNYYHDYDNSKDNVQRNYRGRPMSGNYDGQEYNNRSNRGRQTPENHNQDYDKGQEVPSGQGNNRGRPSNRNNYNQEHFVNNDRQQSSEGPVRGRSKSANDRPRSGRGGRGRGRGRGKQSNESMNNGTDAPVTADGDNVSKEVREDDVTKDNDSQIKEVIRDEVPVEINDVSEPPLEVADTENCDQKTPEDENVPPPSSTNEQPCPEEDSTSPEVVDTAATTTTASIDGATDQ